VALGGDQRKQLVYTDAAGKRVIAFAEKTKYGWTLVAQQDYDEAYQSLAEANTNALILLGITVLFVLVASYVLAGARPPPPHPSADPDLRRHQPRQSRRDHRRGAALRRDRQPRPRHRAVARQRQARRRSARRRAVARRACGEPRAGAHLLRRARQG